MTRSRHLPIFCLPALAIACALVSFAQGARAQYTPSPQHFALEIKFGPYIPHIDSSAGLSGKTPFSDLFGDYNDPAGATPSRALLTQVEFDYQFFHRFGSLGVGLSGGYLRLTAPQPILFGSEPGPLYACDVSGDPGAPRQFTLKGVVKEAGACFSNDRNILNLVPLELLAVYRFDYPDKRWRVPIVPYVKFGFAYYIWWMGTTGEFVTHRDVVSINGGYHDIPKDLPHDKAAGASTGLVVHPGIAIDLGAIDRSAAKIMDEEIGVNRVSLFVELNYAWVNGFGAANKLDLSDTTFNAGMAFEF